MGVPLSKPLNVLIVDDHPSICSLLSNSLRQDSHTVVLAGDGADGLEKFRGPAFHSARWESDRDLTGMRVAVVGMGSSAAQIVPALAGTVKEVQLFARTPNWVLPKPVVEFTPSERERYTRSALYRRLTRFKEFRFRESRAVNGFRYAEGPEQAAMKATALAYLEETIKDPDLRAYMTPQFPLGCKRPILDSDFLPSLNREDVRVIRTGVAAVDEEGIIDEQGEHHAVDAIVMATGFTPTRFIASLDLRGRGGRSVQDVWGLSPRAFCGTTVPGIPNFFMLYGPNTNGGASIMANSTRQAEAVIATMKRMERRGKKVFDTRPTALARWVRMMDEGNARRTASHLTYCSNYYHSPEGRNVTQLPLKYLNYLFALKAWMPFALRLQSR